jgi:hypothetical protein
MERGRAALGPRIHPRGEIFVTRPAHSAASIFGSAASRKRSPVASLSALRLVTIVVAILELAGAAIHRAAREDEAELAFPAMPVPPIDVLLAPQKAPPIP